MFYRNSLFGITVGPAAFAGPLAYPCANLGFTGEVPPADEKLLLSRGITRRALRHTLGFVLRALIAIHSRHCLPAVPSLPDHCARMESGTRWDGNERATPSRWPGLASCKALPSKGGHPPLAMGRLPDRGGT